MTLKLRAYVRRCDLPGCHAAGLWIGAAGEVTPIGTISTTYTKHCASHPEAMQAAYKLLADLDAELMAEVHASRATRRAERCECGPGLHSYHCPQHERHTTEPTA